MSRSCCPRRGQRAGQAIEDEERRTYVYLKRLELHGFKTFADRTELEFTPGITAIVGPNGSGKSNVFDAIRWALGEVGYKSLRSGRMDDVIFAGSESRRAMGMGEVQLTINNDSGALPVDYAEVAVTRRANRGGEGEYLLNMAPCRLPLRIRSISRRKSRGSTS